MRRVLFISLCLFVSTLSFGQNNEVQKGIKEIRFFGVDFSKAKAYGVAESIDQFQDVFGRINGLFISEAKKYNIEKAFKVSSTTTVRQLDDINRNISGDSFYTEDNNYQISEAELANEIKQLPLTDKEGTGLVFVAELLNKTANEGTYHIVFFDIASRDILDTWKASGQAKGFGLRNYWAGSIYNILEKTKIKK